MSIFKINNYDCPTIQYECEECSICEKIEVDFSEDPYIKSEGCYHYNINFIFSKEYNRIKYLLSFTCKNCEYNEIITLLDNNTNNSSDSFYYSCPNCRNICIAIGYSLDDKINLIFRINQRDYIVNVDKDIYLSEALSKLESDYDREYFQKLDIQGFKKGELNLSKFKTIGELNLKNRDMIDVVPRPNTNW